jgi:hypothetical protein
MSFDFENQFSVPHSNRYFAETLPMILTAEIDLIAFAKFLVASFDLEKVHAHLLKYHMKNQDQDIQRFINQTQTVSESSAEELNDANFIYNYVSDLKCLEVFRILTEIRKAELEVCITETVCADVCKHVLMKYMPASNDDAQIVYDSDFLTTFRLGTHLEIMLCNYRGGRTKGLSEFHSEFEACAADLLYTLNFLGLSTIFDKPKLTKDDLQFSMIDYSTVM